MTSKPPSDLVLGHRSADTAPGYVAKRGGVLMSMWCMGVDETDIHIVAGIIERAERYRDALEKIEQRDVPAVSDFIDDDYAAFAREALC